jgi:hypothetical protein
LKIHAQVGKKISRGSVGRKSALYDCGQINVSIGLLTSFENTEKAVKTREGGRSKKKAANKPTCQPAFGKRRRAC